ncbi:fasciclin domain-containing protein [Motilibacter aurantiacus]|uniref:fasciclin domain-containing protein n=1 Tax=Motilibacter aurantiacus TaxID=2714955 RepID=UPI00140BE6E6|nr:fasciclin domain-containing protein [Motilibacter aurantiacus]NHC44010.1 fasciclin domain-containing protein [Motilibacter aurantiacus]
MHVRRALASAAAAGLLGSAAVATAPAASAADPGTASLASVLLSDGGPTYDRDGDDYDIVTGAVLAVLAAKPSSPVAVLADGTRPVTAFLPDDRAFRKLVITLTGSAVKAEEANLAAVASLGIDTVETVLLYHVVAGVTIDSTAASAADGVALPTARGLPLTVDVRQSIRLVDVSGLTKDAKVTNPDLNAGNLQVAHGIERVLLPL